MTDREQRLREIRERYEASTAGEWEVYDSTFSQFVRSKSHELFNVCRIMKLHLKDAWNPEDNAEFIAHAHQDIPFLLAEIERLEKRLEEQHEREWSNLEKLATSFRENF